LSARILITGAAGFLGSHLCDRFISEGHDVVCVDNLITGNRDNIAHLFGNPKFSFIHHDVTEYIYVSGPLDYVLHFASPASPIDYLELPIQTLKVGAMGTHKVLGLAKDKQACFLLASTSEVYGDPRVHPQPESYWGNVNPIGPRGVYDEAKRFAEALVMAVADSHRPHIQYFRPADAASRRKGRVQFHHAGPQGRVADCLWRRNTDAQLLLRGRSDRSDHAAAVFGRGGAGKSWESPGDVRAAAGRARA
jgi:nucleoside-diphosphate-sugar epimerase